MFDEQPPKTSEAPGNVPSEPADMFAGVKDAPDDSGRLPDALSSGMLRKKESSMSVMPDVGGSNQGNGVILQSSGSSLGAKIMITILVLVVIGGFSFGGWWLYKTAQDKAEVAPVVTPKASVSETVVPAVIPAPAEETPPASTSSTTRSSNDDILFGNMVDSDKDGIDDARERESGTDPVKKDTDSDGLSDGDEVLIWRTDPLKADTDGDKYPDGDEVKNGYNPLGPGKMIPAAEATTTIQADAAI